MQNSIIVHIDGDLVFSNERNSVKHLGFIECQYVVQNKKYGDCHNGVLYCKNKEDFLRILDMYNEECNTHIYSAV